MAIRMTPLQRSHAYPLYLLGVLSVWLFFMLKDDLWHLFALWWPMPLTMTFGSFVAGFTATGGSAVAFPVFTKILRIPADDARMFGLMIQSFGMTAASIFIWSRRIPVLGKPILWGVLGSASGMLLAMTSIPLVGSAPKLLFTGISSLFALVLIWTFYFRQQSVRSEIAGWGLRQSLEFFCAGLVGGVFSEAAGCGADMMVFAVMTLVYRVDEHIGISTSVVTMALASIFGFALHGVVMQDINPVVLEYWLLSVPVVIFGAPLGALLMTMISRKQVVLFLCGLISLDLATTGLLVPISLQDIKLVLPITGAAALLLMLAMNTKLKIAPTDSDRC